MLIAIGKPARTLLPIVLCGLLAAAAGSPGFLAAAAAPAAVAAPAQGDPLSGAVRSYYGEMKDVLLRAAERMPESGYGFRPTAGVRSFGQLVGHVADAQHVFCSLALGEKMPNPTVEKTQSAKADLIAALKEAFAFCDRVYNGMTDAAATQEVSLFGTETPRLGVLTANNMHAAEHYGNMVVYLRLQNVAPPTSDPGTHVLSLGSIVPPRR